MSDEACVKLSFGFRGPVETMRIALIEDNEALALGLAHRLRDEGHSVDHIADGAEAAAFLARDGADIVILDVTLPGMSGLEVLRAMRERGDATPVIMLTARGETSDRVAGLDAGADDYLVKPFETEELLARLRALMRRGGGAAGSGEAMEEAIGEIRFDRGARIARAGDETLDLPRRELAVLECLIARRGRITAKATIADHLYGAGADIDESVVEVYVSRLRKRLAPHGARIRSARGLGYMIEDG